MRFPLFCQDPSRVSEYTKIKGSFIFQKKEGFPDKESVYVVAATETMMSLLMGRIIISLIVVENFMKGIGGMIILRQLNRVGHMQYK